MGQEMRLVCLLANPRLCIEARDEVRSILTKTLSWPLVLRLAQKEGVAALVYYHLNELNFTSCPKEIFDALQQSYYRYAVRNVFLAEKAKALLKIFSQERLPCLALKGIFLCSDVYPHMASRPVTDVDLLVHRADLPHMDLLLRQAGYSFIFNSQEIFSTCHRSLNSCVYSDADSSFTLHIHWHPINLTWPLDMLADSNFLKECWKQARLVTFEGIEVLTLTPSHLLMFLAYHTFSHSAERLIMLADIAAVLDKYGQDMDMEHFKKEADSFYLTFVVASALRLTKRLLGVSVHLGFNGILDMPEIFLQRLISFSIKRGKCCYLLSYLIFFSLNKGFCAKMNFLVKTVQGRWRWVLRIS